MSHRVRSLVVLLLLLAAGTAHADRRPILAESGSRVLHGGNPQAAKATRDTIYLIGPWGSPAPVNGQFEDHSGMPDWNGWTHHDLTVPEAPRWNIATYQADNLGETPHGAGNLAAWCGELSYPACTPNDVDGGYGNNYDEWLTWTGTVANSDVPCYVAVEAWLNLDLEYGYDYLLLQYHRYEDIPFTVMERDGQETNLHLQESFQVAPEDYLGEPGARNQVVLQFRVTSDGAFSDADCYYPSRGACQIDDIAVTLGNGGVSTFDDFESGQWESWVPTPRAGVGDFAHILWGLDDLDPCVSNYTPQVCFIDDGYVIPETGGQMCINWCYGPGGYIVNTQGGLAGPDSHLHNQVRSPVIAWPATGAEGALFEYGAYIHEDLSYDSPGIFHTWHVRSISSGDPADLEGTGWQDRNFLYYGPEGYYRQSFDVTDLLVPGTTHVQVALDVIELGYVWGWDGDDGFPAPYFDNVRLVAYPFDGPSLSARQVDLAQDGFPAAGFVDQENLGNNAVRFDMAMNISPAGDLRLDPGDSITVRVVPRRVGEVIEPAPRLHYALRPNPAFDDYRDSGLPLNGSVPGTRNLWDDQQFSFDLPDSGFFYPGDVLHYLIEATSFLDGSQWTSILPADTTGFADFSGPLAYDPDFTVRGLPSFGYNPIHQELLDPPPVLLWDDGGDLESWVAALEGMDFESGIHYDLFQTRSPSSGVGNGLGSRATPALLDQYRTLLYTSGTLGTATIANGDLTHDGSDDVGLLDAWMNLGDKSMFLTGDQLVTDLAQSGAATQAFVQNWLQVDYVASNLRPLISNQVVPRVVTIPGEVFFSLDSWIAYGGCPAINAFDAVTASSGAQRLAEFTDPSGSDGVYSYSAATLVDLPEDKTVIPSHNSAVITLPYDFQFIYTDPDGGPPFPYPARQGVLYDVLYFFGEVIIWDAVDIQEPRQLTVRNYPNPFNPATRIEYSLPQAGHLSVKVFNVRGQLVSTLVDEKREAGPGNVVWDGTDGQGAAVSSGVYFYEVRAGGQVRVQKMALLK